MIGQTSQTDGFDMIAVERQNKNILESNDEEDFRTGDLKKHNRQGGDLREDFDFIKVPK